MKLFRGFSLIEVMIVLSIIMILSVISVPRLNFFWQKSQADILSTQLISALHLAASEAILRHSKMIICGSGDQHTCSNQWHTGYIVKTAQQVIYHFQNVAEKGILHWRAFPRNEQQITFLPTGFPAAENGTFWFCPLDAIKPAWAIVMSQSGRARLVYPDSAGNIHDSQHKQLIC